MRFSLLPVGILNEVTDLSEQMLKSWGVRLLMLDFDNTIVPYTTDHPTDEMESWLERMLSSNIQICVVSNSHNDRVKAFCKKRDIDCITHSRKPFPKGITACMTRYGIPREQCALAGDQIFTDVLGANSCGVRSILVTPIHNHNFWLKARHVLEKPFIYAARKRRITYEEY
ncbi:MAG: YqeG family HAD IIIA-type phosphatase [Oscillospiraceae bacterium]|nr:YqeG family HAD IIIA-type phosphatase [Oscillospiraceae bacterium]